MCGKERRLPSAPIPPCSLMATVGYLAIAVAKAIANCAMSLVVELTFGHSQFGVGRCGWG